MIVSTKQSLIIFAIFLALGVALAIVYKLLCFALNKAILILFPNNPNKKSKINKTLCVNIFVACVVFAIYAALFFVLALNLNYGIYRLYMIFASLCGFYLTHKTLKLKLIKFKKSRIDKKTAN